MSRPSAAVHALRPPTDDQEQARVALLDVINAVDSAETAIAPLRRAAAMIVECMENADLAGDVWKENMVAPSTELEPGSVLMRLVVREYDAKVTEMTGEIRAAAAKVGVR